MRMATVWAPRTGQRTDAAAACAVAAAAPRLAQSWWWWGTGRKGRRRRRPWAAVPPLWRPSVGRGARTPVRGRRRAGLSLFDWCLVNHHHHSSFIIISSFHHHQSITFGHPRWVYCIIVYNTHPAGGPERQLLLLPARRLRLADAAAAAASAATASSCPSASTHSELLHSSTQPGVVGRCLSHRDGGRA